jgi:hypothetical protein
MCSIALDPNSNIGHNQNEPAVGNVSINVAEFPLMRLAPTKSLCITVIDDFITVILYHTTYIMQARISGCMWQRVVCAFLSRNLATMFLSANLAKNGCRLCSTGVCLP